MEQSILKSTKKVLQIGPDDESFDLDIITHINSAFSTLNQVGIGPLAGFAIEDDAAEWDEVVDPGPMQHLLKTCVYLRVKILFDPPAMPHLLASTERQIEEHIFRLSVMRETTDWVDPDPDDVDLEDPFGDTVILDGGGA